MHTLCGRNTIGVNSHHHQALKDLAPGFISMGSAEDGIVEAMYDPSKPFCWGVQWHPEELTTREEAARLFHTFVEMAK